MLHFMSLLALSQQTTTFMCLLLKEKQMESYNVFSLLEDIKRILHNMRICLDNVDSHLARVESTFVSDYVSGDLIDPPLIMCKPLH